VVVAHVFGAPQRGTDTSIAVSGVAGSTTLTAGKLYRIVPDGLDCYIAFGESGGAALDADTGALLKDGVPEVFRCPEGQTTLYYYSAATGTLNVAEMGI